MPHASNRSSLSLVDLAGSERLKRSQVTGAEMKETQFINSSLSCLGNVVNGLYKGVLSRRLLGDGAQGKGPVDMVRGGVFDRET